MQAVDTIVIPRWIVPVEPAGAVLEGFCLVVHDGRILALLPTQDVAYRFHAEVTVRLPDHLVIPGLVNTHTHAAMSLFRGLSDDLPLMEWLEGHIWPAEARWVNDEFARDGTRLAAAEMLKSGTTCFNDMYFFPDDAGRTAAEAGMRAVVGLIVIDFPTAWARDADEYLGKAVEVHDLFRNDPLVTTAFAPHAPYSVSDGPLQRVGTLAEELDIPIHMHVHETREEVETSLERHGRRPLKRLDDLGLLGPRLLAVHMTQLLDEERERVGACGTHVIHCPESNLKLASGFCPVQTLTAGGINVALGTDGAASNNDLDMLGEMRSAALLGKAVAGAADALPATSALRMATLNGARALGLDHVIGSLEPGKAADLVAVDLSDLATEPVYSPVSQLVYAAGRHQVTDVWVAGRHVLKERVLTTLDEDEIRARARYWRTRVSRTEDTHEAP